MEQSNQNTSQAKHELCVIKVLFPVVSAEEAFSIKTGIENLVCGIQESRIEFTTKTMYGSLPTPNSLNPPMPAL